MDFFMVPRRLFAEGAFKAEPYSKREALLDLIQMASIETKDVVVDGMQMQIERGQVFASIRFLARKWGWSNDRTIRTLRALESEHFIERNPNTLISTISICNFDTYSGEPNTPTNTPANTPNGESRTKYKNKEKEQEQEDKEKVIIAKEKSIEDREYAFKEQVYAFSGEWQRQMLDDFILYWSERDLRGKMRFEKEKTWDLPKRLQRWDRNNVERGRASMRVTASAPPKIHTRLSPEEIALDAKRNNEPLAFNVRQAIDIIWEGTIPKERVDAALRAAGYEI